MQSLPSHISNALSADRIRQLLSDAAKANRAAAARQARRARGRHGQAGAHRSRMAAHAGNGAAAGRHSGSGASGGTPPEAPEGPGRALRLIAAVIRDCHLAQRRLAIRRSSLDGYLPHPDAAPDTYREFLLRTSGLLAHEPTAAGRRRGRAIR